MKVKCNCPCHELNKQGRCAHMVACCHNGYKEIPDKEVKKKRMKTEEWNDIFPILPEDVKQEILTKLKQMWKEIGGDEEQLNKLIKDDVGYNSKRFNELPGDKIDNFGTGVS